MSRAATLVLVLACPAFLSAGEPPEALKGADFAAAAAQVFQSARDLGRIQIRPVLPQPEPAPGPQAASVWTRRANRLADELKMPSAVGITSLRAVKVEGGFALEVQGSVSGRFALDLLGTAEPGDGSVMARAQVFIARRGEGAGEEGAVINLIVRLESGTGKVLGNEPVLEGFVFWGRDYESVPFVKAAQPLF